MEYNHLGTTGLKISSIALGGMNLGQMDQNNAFSILDRAHDHGINLLDTASGYGKSEQVIGEWMAAGDLRGEFVINTKVGWPVGQGSNDRGLGRTHLRRQLMQTLLDLGTDYIDIYQAHYYDGHEDLGGLVRYFNEIAERGMIGVIGAPLFTRSHYVVSWYEYAKHHGMNNVGSKLMTTSLLSRGMYDGDIRHVARDCGIGLITFGSLGGGLLTGRYHSSKDYPEGGRKMFEETVKSGKIDPLVDRLIELSSELDVTPAQLSFAWVLHHDFMDSVVIGASSADQLDNILAAVDIKLSDDVFNELKELSDRYRLW